MIMSLGQVTGRMSNCYNMLECLKVIQSIVCSVRSPIGEVNKH